LKCNGRSFFNSFTSTDKFVAMVVTSMFVKSASCVSTLEADAADSARGVQLPVGHTGHMKVLGVS
jgi:hypothetical protein